MKQEDLSFLPLTDMRSPVAIVCRIMISVEFMILDLNFDGYKERKLLSAHVALF